MFYVIFRILAISLLKNGICSRIVFFFNSQNGEILPQKKSLYTHLSSAGPPLRTDLRVSLLAPFFFCRREIVERFAARVFTLFGQEGFVRGARQAIDKQICISLLFINILFFIDFS
jgi:hypothetical protein